MAALALPLRMQPSPEFPVEVKGWAGLRDPLEQLTKLAFGLPDVGPPAHQIRRQTNFGVDTSGRNGPGGASA